MLQTVSDEIREQSIKWLKQLELSDHMILKLDHRLNPIELRDLAREIQQKVTKTGSQAFRDASGN